MNASAWEMLSARYGCPPSTGGSGRLVDRGLPECVMFQIDLICNHMHVNTLPPKGIHVDLALWPQPAIVRRPQINIRAAPAAGTRDSVGNILHSLQTLPRRPGDLGRRHDHLPKER